jgi:hypothetical protein
MAADESSAKHYDRHVDQTETGRSGGGVFHGADDHESRGCQSQQEQGLLSNEPVYFRFSKGCSSKEIFLRSMESIGAKNRDVISIPCLS